MKDIFKYIPGFRSNFKWKIACALIYYAICIYLLPASFIGGIACLAIPFVFFAIKDNSKAKKNAKFPAFTKTVETRTPIMLTKKLTVVIGIYMAVLLSLGAYSASIQSKKDAFKQKVLANVEAERDADAAFLAAEDKRLADIKATEDKRLADIKDIEDKKNSDAKAKVDAQKKAQADKIGYDTGITYDQLARNPNDHIAEKVKFTGKVIQVMEQDSQVQLRMAVDDNYDNILLASYDSSIMSSRVLQNDNITIKGMSTGVITYKSTMGGDITIPSVTADSIK